MKVRVVAILIVAATVGGCLKDQTMTHATCTMEMLNRNFNAPTSANAGQDFDRCMNQNGYKKNQSRFCTHVPLGRASQDCYQPDTLWGQIGWQIEMALRSN
jgi:hypothetical protein